MIRMNETKKFWKQAQKAGENEKTDWNGGKFAENDLGEPKVKKLGEEMSKYVKYQSF